MESIIIQTHIIKILCTFKRGLRKQVLVKDVFNIAGVCKKWREIVKSMLSGMRLNPMKHNVEEALIHFNNQYCLIGHIHSVVPYDGGRGFNSDDGVNYKLFNNHKEKVESLAKHIEYLDIRNRNPSFSSSLIQLPLPNLKRLSFDYNTSDKVKDISHTICNQLQELDVYCQSEDVYTLIGACNNLRKLTLKSYNRDMTRLFPLLSRHLISLHLNSGNNQIPYHLLPTTLEELKIPYCKESKHYEYLINQKIKKTNTFELAPELKGILPLTSLETVSFNVHGSRFLKDSDISVSLLPNTVQKLKLHTNGLLGAITCINITLMTQNITSLSLRFIMKDYEYRQIYIIGSLAKIIDNCKKIKKLSVFCTSYPSQKEQYQILYQSIQRSKSLERIEFAGGTLSYVTPIISDLNKATSPYKGLVAIQSRGHAILNTNNYHIYDIDSISNIIIKE